MLNFQKIILFIFLTSAHISLQAFGLWQCAGMLLSDVNPLYWNVCGIEFGAEVLYLKRKDCSGGIDIASDGISGPIALKTQDIEDCWDWGYCLTGRVNVQEGKTVEIVWQRTRDFHETANAESMTNELYSAYSNFGMLPAGGFEDIDGSSLQTIALESHIHSIELNVKRNWVLLRGAFLYGYRYQSIDERIKYDTLSESKWYRSGTSAKNDMHGFQMGLEAFIPCTGSIGIQLYGKGALYVNCAEYEFHATAPSLFFPLAEVKRETVKAWGADAGASVVYQWCRNVCFSFGYKYLCFDNVALAIENFDKSPPFEGYEGDRASAVNNSACLSFHGISLGISLIW